MKKWTLATFLFLMALNAKAQNSYQHFDLRSFQRVSPSKKQSWGTCWAFASIASIESNIITRLRLKDVDLSEYHMDKYSGFSRSGHASHYRPGEWYSGQGENFFGSNSDNLTSGLIVHIGGDFKVAASYLANNGGAVKQTVEVEPNHTDHKKIGDNPFEGILKKNPGPFYFPQDIEWLSYGSTDDNIARIQSTIMQHGSVASTQFMDDDPISHNGSIELHYYHGQEKPNHAVNIIGWTKGIAFPPLLPGVWIVQDSDHKNKEGNHIGYFYVPFWDIHVGQHPEMGAVSFKNVRITPPQKVFTHALHGWQHDFSVKGIKKISNIHSFDKPEQITGVGFFTVKPNEEVSIQIENLKKKKLCGSKKLNFTNPGFHRIKLSCQKSSDTVRVIQENKSQHYGLDASKVFNVLLGNQYKMPLESEPILVKSSSSPGESFYFLDGRWEDLFHHPFPQEETEHGIRYSKIKTANFPLFLYLKK